MRWDIFCKVIDNFGDIGVTWRLARQLQHEHGYQVRLWVDELEAFYAICPAAANTLQRQTIEHVEIYTWNEYNLQIAQAADVVIEAFACEIPASYLDKMREKALKPLWLNLEYLTAQTWAADCHALPSMQGAGLSKFFFFPGFSEAVGGLLRERDLIAQRDAFIASPQAQATFLASLGVKKAEGRQLISLFAYENEAVASWLDALSVQPQKNHVLVPRSKVLSSVQAWLGAELSRGKVVQRGQLNIQLIEFVEQREFDKLLWCCDVNCVRGEDSLVRAIWAGKPFVWHIYPQDDDAHWDKLNAFLELYLATTPEPIKTYISQFFIDWNAQQITATSWKCWQENWVQIQAVTENFTNQQIKLPDLASRLANFHKNWL
ncbi:elongation factor P maturation arginine rhamnosyltransferase EarP [Pseudomonas sp. F1_0610]|uniref:elongation factor P maturation arginine rhamnosyltransferase EarP n=1 Tax=Pseudomonas sp. F1_0610 TaxID=3114284 RepID=UPI0039C03EAC